MKKPPHQGSGIVEDVSRWRLGEKGRKGTNPSRPYSMPSCERQDAQAISVQPRRQNHRGQPTLTGA